VFIYYENLEKVHNTEAGKNNGNGMYTKE